MTARPGTTIVLLLLTALAGCSSGDSESADQPDGRRVGELGAARARARRRWASATRSASRRPPTRSTRATPSRAGSRTPPQTYKVGKLSALDDGHLLAVDSPTVRARIAEGVPAGPAGATSAATRPPSGSAGSRRSGSARRSSRPTPAPTGSAATWWALRKEGALISLPRKVKGVLDSPDALDRFGTCGTAAPDAKSFQRVVCSERHSWRAVDVVDLPASTRYLAKDAAATGDAACKDVAAERANGALKYTWSLRVAHPGAVEGRAAVRVLLGAGGVTVSLGQ